MTIEVKKATPTRLRTLGLDERWLQDRIDEDPAIIGLGDIQVQRREKPQPTGGRIDFVLYDPDQELRYTVEVMLGTLDERHIIRTIEYWDIERQRFPAYDHRAVIIAEEITARFFNVIRLLNRAVPLIAIQLNALTVDNAVILHFTKVLDVYQEAEVDDEAAGEQVDRRYWERRASAGALATIDKIVTLVEHVSSPARVTYNKNHIALGTTGVNFCWFHPPREASHCHLRLRARPDSRDQIVSMFADTGLYVRPFQSDRVTFKLTVGDIDQYVQPIGQSIQICESQSRGGDGAP